MVITGYEVQAVRRQIRFSLAGMYQSAEHADALEELVKQSAEAFAIWSILTNVVQVRVEGQLMPLSSALHAKRLLSKIRRTLTRGVQEHDPAVWRRHKRLLERIAELSRVTSEGLANRFDTVHHAVSMPAWWPKGLG